MTPDNFEKCSIQALLSKTGLLPEEKELLTPQEQDKLEPEGDWTREETFKLLDSISAHGEDWDKVAETVGGGKTQQQCISHFISLPINENTSEKIHNINAHAMKAQQNKQQVLSEQATIPTVFSDVSNPILAQVALFGRLLEHYGLDEEDKHVKVAKEETLVSGLRSQTKIDEQPEMQVDAIKQDIPEQHIMSQGL